MPQAYLSAVLTAPQKVDLREAPFPPKLEANEVLIEVAAAGICGTDLAIYSGEYRVPLPLVLGHEFSGRVVESSAGARGKWLVGRWVTAEINNTCVAYGRRSRCEACRRGLPTHCQRRTVVGIVGHDGAFAQYLRVPIGSVHVLPRVISPKAGVFVEPLAAAIRTFELTPLAGGETVVVLGCGRLGKLIALVAHKLGARVIAVGRTATKIAAVAEYASELVALGDHALEFPPQAVPKRKNGGRLRVQRLANAGELQMLVMDRTRGLGADVVVEATGCAQNLELALKLVRPRGTIALKSTPGVPMERWDTTMTAVDEVCIQGSRCGPFDKAIAFMEEHGVPNESWITAEFPLEQCAEALEAARTQPKVVLTIGS